ncbi:MAG: hypothetical protein ACYDC5_04350 [Candidatus Dormibacteria bacterium]
MGLDLPLDVPGHGGGSAGTASLELAMAALGRRYGRVVVRAGGNPSRGGLQTGIGSLDALFPEAGLPRGRLSWIRGESGAGSFDLGLALLARLSLALPVAVVDFDHRVDPGDVADYGGELGHCWVVRPRTLEQGWAAARSLLKAGVEFCLLQAAKWPPVGRAIPALLLAALEEGSGVAVMGGGLTVPLEVGGRLSVELSCRRVGWSMAHGDVAGVLIHLLVARSRMSPSGRGCELRIDFPRPYPRTAGIVDLGMLSSSGLSDSNPWTTPLAVAER